MALNSATATLDRPTPTEAGRAELVHGLYAVAPLAREGWCTYRGTERGHQAGTHLIDLVHDDEWTRAVPTSGLSPWAIGYALGLRRAVRGMQADTLAAVLDASSRPMPEILTRREAEDTYGVSYAQVRLALEKSYLYPLYVDRDQAIHLLADDVAAWQAGRPALAADVLRQLPQRRTPAGYTPHYRPSPDPLPVPAATAEPTRERIALAIALRLGWLDRWETRADNTFAVDIDGTHGTLTRPDVPWFALGLGDGHGVGHSAAVAFAPNQG